MKKFKSLLAWITLIVFAFGSIGNVALASDPPAPVQEQQGEATPSASPAAEPAAEPSVEPGTDAGTSGTGADAAAGDATDAPNDLDGIIPPGAEVVVTFELRLAEDIEARVYTPDTPQQAPVRLYALINGVDAEGAELHIEHPLAEVYDTRFDWSGCTETNAGTYTAAVGGMVGEWPVVAEPLAWTIAPYEIDTSEAMEAVGCVSLRENRFTFGDSPNLIQLDSISTNRMLRLGAHTLSEGALAEDGTLAVGDHFVYFTIEIADSNCVWGSSVSSSEYTGSLDFTVVPKEILVTPPVITDELHYGMEYSELNLVGGNPPPDGHFEIVEEGAYEGGGMQDVDVQLMDENDQPYESGNFSFDAPPMMLFSVIAPTGPARIVNINWGPILGKNGKTDIVYQASENHFADESQYPIVTVPSGAPADLIYVEYTGPWTSPAKTAHDAGTYTITVKIKNEHRDNFEFDNNAIQSISFTIQKQKITVLPHTQLTKHYGALSNAEFNTLAYFDVTPTNILTGTWTNADRTEAIDALLFGNVSAAFPASPGSERVDGEYSTVLTGFGINTDYLKNYIFEYPSPLPKVKILSNGVCPNELEIESKVGGFFDKTVSSFKVPSGYSVSFTSPDPGFHGTWHTTVPASFVSTFTDGAKDLTYYLRHEASGLIYEAQHIEFDVDSTHPSTSAISIQHSTSAVTNDPITVVISGVGGQVGKQDSCLILTEADSVGETVVLPVQSDGTWTITRTFAKNPGVITVKAWDEATQSAPHNKVSSAAIRNIDTTAPVFGTPNAFNPAISTTGPVQVTMPVWDLGNAAGGGDAGTGSGFAAIASVKLYGGNLPANGKAMVYSAGTKTAVLSDINANGTYYAIATDTAGNETTSASFVINWITYQGPYVDQAKTVLSKSTATRGSIRVTLKLYDDNTIAAAARELTGLTILAPDGVTPITPISVTPSLNTVGAQETTVVFEASASGTYSVLVRNRANQSNILTNQPLVISNIDTSASEIVSFVAAASTIKPNKNASQLDYTLRDSGSTGTSDSFWGLQRAELFYKKNATAGEESRGTVYPAASKKNSYSDSLSAALNGLYILRVWDQAEKNDGLDADEAGKNREYTLPVDWIDVVKPTIEEKIPHLTDPTKDPVSVTLSLKDTGADSAGNPTGTGHVRIASFTIHKPDNAGLLTDYTAQNENTANVTVAFQATVNGEYKIRAVDAAGNEETFSVFINNISTTRPSIIDYTLTKDHATRQPVKVSIRFQDSALGSFGYDTTNLLGINKIDVVDARTNASIPGYPQTLNHSGNTIFTHDFTVQESGLYLVKITNLAGNLNIEENWKVQVTNIDHVAPVLTIDTARPANPPIGALKTDAMIYFTATDAGGCADNAGIKTARNFYGVKKVRVISDDARFNPVEFIVAENGHNTSYTNYFFAPCNATYTVQVWDLAAASDNASPVEQVIVVDWLDRFAPTLTTALTPPRPSDSGKPVQSPIMLEVNVSDIGRDRADSGNPTHKDFVAVAGIIVTSPSGRILSPITGSVIPTAATGTPPEAKLKAQYNLTENGEYTVIAWDKAGNYSDPVKVFVDWIDDAAPTVVSETHSDEVTRQPVPVTVSIEDTGTPNYTRLCFIGIDRVKVTLEDGVTEIPATLVKKADATASSPAKWEATFAAPDSGKYLVTAWDFAGNQSAAYTVSVDNIDKRPFTAGDLSVSYDTDEVATNKNVIITVTAKAENAAFFFDSLHGKHGGFGRILVLCDQTNEKVSDVTFGKNAGYYTSSFSAPLNGLTYTITVWDRAGLNDGEPGFALHTKKIDWIDRVKPSVRASDWETRPTRDGLTVWLFAGDFGGDYAEVDKGTATDPKYVGVADLYITGGNFGNTPHRINYNQAKTVNDYDLATVIVGANGTYTLTAVDKAGNVSTYNFTVNNIDFDDPHVRAKGYYDVAGTSPFMKVEAWDDIQLEWVRIYKYNGEGKSPTYVHGDDLTGKNTRTFTYNYHPKSPGTYFAVAKDITGRLSARSALVTFGGIDDSDFDDINDKIAALLGYPPTNPLGIPVSVLLFNGYNLQLEGNGAQPSVFFDPAMGKQLWESLAANGLVNILKYGQKEFDSLEAAKALNEKTFVLQLDYKNRKGIGVIGEYLVFFEPKGDSYSFTDAVSLKDTMPLAEGQTYIGLASSDGRIVLLALWDGEKAVRDLMVFDVQNRMFVSALGSAGSTRFDMDAIASQIAYAKDDVLTLLNLTTAEAVVDGNTQVNALSLTETGTLLLSVADGWRTSLVGGLTQDELNDNDYYFPTQRGDFPQTIVVDSEEGEKTATFDGRLFIDPARRSIYTALPMEMDKTILNADGTLK